MQLMDQITVIYSLSWIDDQQQEYDTYNII